LRDVSSALRGRLTADHVAASYESLICFFDTHAASGWQQYPRKLAFYNWRLI
jgi:hypothetical protein